MSNPPGGGDSRRSQWAGVTIFGSATNAVTDDSSPWNIVRAVTLTKPRSESSSIPVHSCMAMGLGGVPLTPTPPVDGFFGASKALVEIGRLDGLRIGLGGPFGAAVAHGVISGTGGIRAAGDLVARVQVAQNMRRDQAKGYVASEPGRSVEGISEPVVMNEWRKGRALGRVNAVPGAAVGIDAKFRIAELLDIEINCVKKFRGRTGW